MTPPPKDHFSLDEIAERWRVKVVDVQYYAIHGMLEVEAWLYVPGVRIKRRSTAAVKQNAVHVVVDPAELICIFRGDEGNFRLSETDLVVSRAERDRFEHEHRMKRDPEVESGQTNTGMCRASASRVSFPGRPSVMRAIVAQFEERCAKKILEKSLQKEGDYLMAWAAKHISGIQIPTSRTIRNAIRSKYRENACAIESAV